VHGRHEAFVEAEGIVDNLGQRGQAVSGAGRGEGMRGKYERHELIFFGSPSLHTIVIATHQQSSFPSVIPSLPPFLPPSLRSPSSVPGGIGDDLLALVCVQVHTADKHGGVVLGRGGHDHLLGTVLKVRLGRALGQVDAWRGK